VPIEERLIHGHVFDVASIAANLVEQPLQRSRSHISLGVGLATIGLDEKTVADGERNVAALEFCKRLLQIAIFRPFNIGGGELNNPDGSRGPGSWRIGPHISPESVLTASQPGAGVST